MTDREMLSCDGCIFVDTFILGSRFSYICGLGLDTIFHNRNESIYDKGNLGCSKINMNPKDPCPGRYTDEEIQKKLGIDESLIG